MLSTKNFFTEANYYENKNDEENNKKSLNLEVNTFSNDDFK